MERSLNKDIDKSRLPNYKSCIFTNYNNDQLMNEEYVEMMVTPDVSVKKKMSEDQNHASSQMFPNIPLPQVGTLLIVTIKSLNCCSQRKVRTYLKRIL